MPKKTWGVIEIRRTTSGWWDGVVNIEALVEAVPEVTGPLFDVDNDKGLKPIAARREVPADRSFMTETLLKEMGILHYNDSWIGSDEIEEVFSVTRPKKGWATVFNLIKNFASQYGGENVRLIVWFS